MARIKRDDLVDDRAFSYAPGVRLADADSLGHARIASRVCDIAEQSEGGSSVAVFGPWGAGKSSLFGLIAEEAAARQESASVFLRTVHFDASANASESFAVNFLSEIGRGLGSRQRALAEQSLFQLRRTLRIPFVPRFLPKWGRALLALFLILGIFVLAPVVLLAVEDGWLVTPPADPVADAFERIVDWFGVAVGGTLIITVITVLTQLTTVTVEQAAPNQVTQFREIFERTISSANREPKRRVRIVNKAREKLGTARPGRQAVLPLF